MWPGIAGFGDDRQHPCGGQADREKQGRVRPFSKHDYGDRRRYDRKRADDDAGIGRGGKLQAGNEQCGIADAAGACLQQQEEPVPPGQPRPWGRPCPHQQEKKREGNHEAQRRRRERRQIGRDDLARDHGAADKHHCERQINISLSLLRHSAAVRIEDGGRRNDPHRAVLYEIADAEVSSLPAHRHRARSRICARRRASCGSGRRSHRQLPLQRVACPRQSAAGRCPSDAG